MKNFEAVFENHSFDKNKLLAFGFIQKQEGYSYSFPLSQKSFELRVFISLRGNVTADVFDVETQDFYALAKVPTATGAFVGKIRAECEAFLYEVAEKCFFPEVFKSHQAKQIVAFLREKHNNELEFLWPKSPLSAIVRRKDNDKWYAVFLNVSRSKLGLASTEDIDMINLKAKADEIDQLIDGERYFPAYHMNKKHWYTICLDGLVSTEEICHRIDKSYVLAQKGNKKGFTR